MAHGSGKKKDASHAGGANVGLFNFPRRAGMPALDSIVEVKSLAPPAGGRGGVVAHALTAVPLAGSKYRILKTNEVDEYERGATAHGMLAATAATAATAAAPLSDNFTGTSRKAAKISTGKGKIERFADLKALVASLPAESEMIDHDPPIKTTSTSGRVKEEQRQVRVRAFLYAASRESDNDFHLIIGRDPKKHPELYMTMELSGLPSKKSASFHKLKAARDAYKGFFGANLPGAGYEFPDPPIPVEIEGSLFFDMKHAKGSRPGPKSLKSRMPTIWEVHPITKIVFEP